MKILYVADRLSYNGRSTYALSLAGGLKEAGAELEFCLSGGDLRPRLDALGIENFLIKYNFFSFRKLISFLAEFRADVVHVTSEQALRAGMKIARRLKAPYLVTLHDLLEAENLKLPLEEILSVIVGNEGLREVLVNRLKVPKTKIRLIPKGVDLADFDLPPVEFEKRIPVIGCIGRMVSGKGQEQFLRAARLVLDAGNEALFILVGQGPEERRIRRLVKELELTESVTVSPPMPVASDIYRVMDIVVLPATKAASSTTALEAMAARRPVIASVVGDLLHLVKNEENGLAVEAGNVEHLARAIIRLVEDADFARELGERARAFVSRKYPRSRMIEATMALYEEIAHGELVRT